MERYGAGNIVISDYDPAWPAMFEQEKANVLSAVSNMAFIIEHVGSTAVPGLPAKPIIDLLVGVRDLSQARASCIVPMQQCGYAYLPEYESWLPDELFFRKGVPAWTHHAHLMEPSSPKWEEVILLRDYLRAHSDEAIAYGDLKRALADECGEDIASYRTRKGAFVTRALSRARAERAMT
jgi:GrpB-like predicted nucleotidyltransferase (UPF0157 family)